MTIWETIDEENLTLATEVPGAGCLVAAPGIGMTFVPGTRLTMLKTPIGAVTHVLQRDERTAPPLVAGKTAAQIASERPANPDPGAQAYYTQDDPEY